MSRNESLRRASLTLATNACLLLLCATSAHAAALFGAYTRGNDLVPDLSAEDGGAGSTSAAILESTFEAQASLGGATYTPVLKAKSVSVNAVGDDDFTASVAEAYQTFTSAVAQTITLDVTLHGVVTNVGTPLSSSYVLADIKVKGGSGFAVQDTYCSSGQYAFGSYLCGSTLGSSNLYIPNGDLTLPDTITFDVEAGEQFAVYGILRANSRDGTSNAFDTLEMSFEDDTFITAAVPEPSTALLCGGGLLVLGVRGRLGRKRGR